MCFRLMDLVVETVCKCSDEFDDGVQLQVLKVLLTAVTSAYCEVHEASLLLAVRACFHIHLISKNPVNKTTAKAALTQMLSAVNVKMEMFDTRARADSDASLSLSVLQGLEQEAEAEGSVSITDKQAFIDIGGDVIPNANIIDTKGNDTNEEEDSGNNRRLDEGAGASSVSVGVSSVSSVDADLEADSDTTSLPSQIGVENSSAVASSSVNFPSIMHKDSFLLFRALCKLSMKGLQDDAGGSPLDPIAMQNK